MRKNLSGVVVGKHVYDIDTVAHYMDNEIREMLSNSPRKWLDEQEFVDAYCEAHKAVYGEDFVLP